MPVDPRAPLNPDRLQLGWQYALLHPDPGPPPKRPTPPEQHRLRPQWRENQRREERQLNRPLEFAGALALGMAAFFGILSWPLGAVPGWGAAVAIGVCLFLAGVAAYAVWQGEQALRMRLAEEQQRVERLRADRERRLHDAQEDHARRFDAWRARKAAFDAQYEWYAVTVPQDVPRVEVAGGTLAGWQALVTTLGASCIEAGSEVTVVDLSEGAVAGDLLALISDRDPRVWVLPEDLPKLDLGVGLNAEALADVLALFVSVGEDGSQSRHLAADNAILQRILGLFGDRASVARVTAALRVLVQAGDGRGEPDDSPLTGEQVKRLREVFGREDSDRLVRQRGWALEAQLRKLDDLGSDAVRTGPGQLRVLATGRGDGALGSAALGTYLTTALLHEFRRGPRREHWSRGLFVCGAEKLRGDVLDRLHDTCAASGIGLVTFFRTIPPHVKGRLGRGGAAVAFMRPGRPEDAKVASEHIGTGRRFTLNDLTQVVDDAVTDSGAGPYTSTGVSGGPAGKAGTAAAAQRNGQGRDHTGEEPWAGLTESSWSRHGADDTGRSASGGRVLTQDVLTRTSWGRGTSRVVGSGEPVSRATHGSREVAAQPDQLQALPTSAFIVCHDFSAGRRVVCGDANPAIASLPRATRTEPGDASRKRSGERTSESGAEQAASARNGPTGPASNARSGTTAEEGASPPADSTGAAYGSGRPYAGDSRAGTPATPDRDELADLPPNLGPPPERLDWRNRR